MNRTWLVFMAANAVAAWWVVHHFAEWAAWR
jgi:hypothetical protein